MPLKTLRHALMRAVAPALAIAPLGALPANAETLEEALNGGQRTVAVARVVVAGADTFGTTDPVRLLEVLEGVRSAYAPKGTDRDAASQLEQSRATMEPGNYDAARIEHIRQTLTRALVGAGYLSSGALVDAKQDFTSRTLTVSIVEGSLGTVSIEGNRGLSKAYIENRLRAGISAPFNINQAGQTLQVAMQDPLIEKLDANVKPGLKAGEADLELLVKRRRPFGSNLTVANDRSPSIGSWRTEGSLSTRNWTGAGDSVSAMASNTEGMTGYGGSISVPLTSYDTRLTVSGSKNGSTIVEEPFAAIGIGGDSYEFSAEIAHPLYRTPRQELALSLSATRKSSTTTLFGEPFSFSPGVIDGDSTATVLRFAQSWIDRQDEGIFAVKSTIAAGVDIATDSIIDGDTGRPAPDAQFVSWLVQGQLVRRFGLGVEPGDLLSNAIVRFDGQLAGDDLLPMEKFSVGGAESVRGYRNNTMVRDNGATASIEVRVPLFRWQAFSELDATEAGVLQLAAFVDGAYAVNRSESPTNPQPFTSMASAGVGILWDPLPYVSTQAYYGYDLMNRADPTVRDLQDRGIHLSFSVDVGGLAEDTGDALESWLAGSE